MASFAGKVAIITGGASGIGKAIGEEIASRGARVVLADLDGERAEQAARGIVQEGGQPVPPRMPRPSTESSGCRPRSEARVRPSESGSASSARG